MENQIINENEQNAPKINNLFFTGTEILNMPEDTTSFLWAQYIKKHQVAILAGTSDVGKSTFLRQLAIEVSTGAKEFLGMPLSTKYQKSVYYSTEDNQYSTKSVLDKQLDGLQKGKKLDDLYFLFEQEKPLKQIRDLLKDSPVDLIIIDSLGDVIDGNINDSVTVRKMLKEFTDLATRYDCAIILLHHIGKGKEEGPANKSNLLGSVAIEAKVRLVMELKNSKQNDNERELWFTKGNYLSQQVKNQGLLLEFNEDLLFSFHGEILQKSTSGSLDGKRKSKYEKEKILPEIVRLKSNELSFEKVEEELKRLFPTINIPSLSTIKNWFEEWNTEHKLAA